MIDIAEGECAERRNFSGRDDQAAGDAQGADSGVLRQHGFDAQRAQNQAPTEPFLHLSFAVGHFFLNCHADF